MYKLDRKLGKGGFGQVYVGRRVTGGIGCSGAEAFEVSSLLCISGLSLVNSRTKLILVLMVVPVFDCRLL